MRERLSYLADSFRRRSRSFLITSMSMFVLECERRMLTYFSGVVVEDFFLSFETLRGAIGAGLGSMACLRTSRDLPRE